MIVTKTFESGIGVVNAAIVEFDGVALLAQRGSKGETRLFIWGPAQSDADDNPGWAKLDELCAAELAKYVHVGLSIDHDDHYEWLGEPIPDLV